MSAFEFNSSLYKIVYSLSSHRKFTHLHPQGQFAFFWNFFLWIPTGAASGTALFLLGVGDLAITIALLVGVIFQSTYLPHTYSGCQGADTWQNATNTSNFFQVASTISDLNVTSAQDVCFQYVENWAFGIAIV